MKTCDRDQSLSRVRAWT